eukprot:COSAG02_NODE_4723_length_5050_cov_2.928701_1_plen_801_part_00
MRKLRHHQYTLHKCDPRSGGAASRALAQSCKIFHIIKDAGGVVGVPAGSTEQVQVDGLLRVKKTCEHERRWMTFDDETGREMGGIEKSLDGNAIKLVSRSGDFAEWYPRLPSEPEFEEGDVVALCPAPPGSSYDRSHLTRDTQNARQLGVISRRAIVEGSLPDSKCPRSDFDTIAYCGRVPVKVIGSVRAGDLLVPSGGNDGTAVAVTGFSAIKVGRAEIDIEDPFCPNSNRYTRSSNTECGIELEHVRQSHQKWHHADAIVFSPSETVTDQHHLCCAGKDWPRVGMVVLTIAVLIVGVVAWLLLSQRAEYGCTRIELAHGSISGQCDGAPGSTCSYESCSSGYALVSRQEASSDAPMSAQAGNLGITSVAANHNVALDFLRCTTCFGRDGLMCQPPNRTFPLPDPKRPAPPFEPLRTFDERYLYDCPSDTDSLRDCESSGGSVCYGEYHGIRPCDVCQTAGQAENGYQPAGLACEATSKGLNWHLREDDAPHSACLSDPNANPDVLYPSWYKNSTLQIDRCDRHVTALQDDITRTIGMCIPLERQHLVGDSGNNSAASSDSTGDGNGDALTTRASELIEADVDQSHRAARKRRSDEKQTTSLTSLSMSRTDVDRPVNKGGANQRFCDDMGTGRSSGPREYSGTEMHCVRTHCPVEMLYMLRLGACRMCEGVEVVVRIPRTAIPTNVGEVTTITVPCPVRFTGTVNRTCTSDGWAEESSVAGACVRKTCPATTFRLEGWVATMGSEVRKQHEVSIPDTTEGSGRVSVRCPKGYHGELSVACDIGADAWSSRRDCTFLRGV